MRTFFPPNYLAQLLRFIVLGLVFLAAPAQAQQRCQVVAPDGLGDYRTVQEAVMAARDFMQVPATIFIKNGTYHEKLLVPPQKTHLTLIGESQQETIITFGDYSDDAAQHSTYTSATVRVEASDFAAENITFGNSAGRVGQAFGLVFMNCKLTAAPEATKVYLGWP